MSTRLLKPTHSRPQLCLHCSLICQPSSNDNLQLCEQCTTTLFAKISEDLATMSEDELYALITHTRTWLGHVMHLGSALIVLILLVVFIWKFKG